MKQAAPLALAAVLAACAPGQGANETADEAAGDSAAATAAATEEAMSRTSDPAPADSRRPTPFRRPRRAPARRGDAGALPPVHKATNP
jgi:hypothetical protein